MALWGAAACVDAEEDETVSEEAGELNYYSRIVTFGDSYSDDGGSRGSEDITTSLLQPIGPVPVDPLLYQMVLPDNIHYTTGHWSNGKTAVEHLATKMNLTHEDYAVGGARAGYINYYTWIDPYISTGALGQIDRYKAAHNNVADPNALYVMFIGANDLFYSLDYIDSTPTTSMVRTWADWSVNYIKAGIQVLKNAGARKFMVVSSTDLGKLPWATVENWQGDNFVSESNTFRDRVNTRLSAELPSMETATVKIYYFNHVTASNAIRANPGAYGLTNITQSCWPGAGTGVWAPAPCGNPNQYYFWDAYHPTTKVHDLIADRMKLLVQ